jgi:hypothetical protein
MELANELKNGPQPNSLVLSIETSTADPTSYLAASTKKQKRKISEIPISIGVMWRDVEVDLPATSVVEVSGTPDTQSTQSCHRAIEL